MDLRGMRYSCRARWLEPIYDYGLLPDGMERQGPGSRIDISFTSIAEIVVRRTSQPFDVILAMLTKVSPALSPQAEPPTGAPLVRADGPRVSLRIVRSEEGAEIAVPDLARV